jgi:GT2 family glycosyltransferase
VAPVLGFLVIPVMIVPILARPELLDRMLKTIDYPVEHLVIIDNGHCVRKVVARNVWNVHVITMPTNLGVAASWNLGIKSMPQAPWWLVSNFDVEWPAGSLQSFTHAASSDTLALSGGTPPWCAFSIGANVVETVGLFDEAFYPAYYEDTDYERRCNHHGISVTHTGVKVEHTNSSTLAVHNYAEKNNTTFHDNRRHYENKAASGDFSQGGWSLLRRRGNSWD